MSSLSLSGSSLPHSGLLMAPSISSVGTSSGSSEANLPTRRTSGPYVLAPGELPSVLQPIVPQHPPAKRPWPTPLQSSSGARFGSWTSQAPFASRGGSQADDSAASSVAPQSPRSGPDRFAASSLPASRAPSLLPTPAPADYDPATASLRSTLALLGRGNLLYVNDSADLDAVASCWAAAAMHPPQERAALFASIDWAVQGYTHTPRNYALDLFHWAWLAPSLPAGLGAFRQALQLDPKLGDVMQRVLFHATAPQAQGTLLPQLGKTFCLLLGELAWAQQALAASLRAGAFVDANQLACELQAHSRRPFVAHWASFICAFELNGGTQLPGHFDQERTKNIFWARGLVATVRGWNGDQHALAQGALAQQDYSMVWQMFLARYAALCPGDFVAPPRLMAASNLRGSNNRCLGGLLWSDLIQLPFPKKWAAYQADLMQEYVQCSEPVLCSPEALRLPRLSLVAANQ